MRLTIPLLSVAVMSALVTPAVAAPRPSSIPIPDDFQPGVGHSECPSQDYRPHV